MHRLVVVLALAANAHLALAQGKTFDATVNVPQSITVSLPREAAGRPHLECQSTSPVGTRMTYDTAVVVGQNYRFDNVVVQWVNAASAVKMQIDCQAIDSASTVPLTLNVQPASISDVKATIVPGGATIGESVTPQVRLQVLLGSRLLPLARQQVSLKLPGTTATFSPAESTNLEGIATFPPITQVAVADGAKDTTVTIDIPGVPELKLPFVVNPPPLDSVRFPQQPARAVAGEAFDIPIPGYGARGGRNVCDPGAVTIVRVGGTGQLKQRGNTTATYSAACTKNLMVIDGLTYEGAIQDFTMEVTVKGITKTLKVVTEAGTAAVLRFTQEPPKFLVASADKDMAPVPKLRLEDRFGNPIAGHTIAATLRCGNDSCGDAFFSGTSIVTTSTEGIADFSGMRFIGRENDYTLCFEDVTLGGGDMCRLSTLQLLRARRSTPVAVATANYNVDREYNKNFVIISAIHSISGHKPTNEFFDIRFRFRLPAGFSAHVSADLNLERASFAEKDTGTVNGGRDVTDAVGMINWSGPSNDGVAHDVMRVTDSRTDALDRLLVIGTQVRIFSGVPYAGVHAGNVEMGHSLFFGSSFTLGYLEPLSYLPIKLPDNPAVYPTRRNLIAEAFLRSSGVNFFEFLNVRATFLLPFETARRVQSRIAIAVPIGGIKDF